MLLESVSVLYLILPPLIFVFGWLDFVPSFAVLLVLCVAFYKPLLMFLKTRNFFPPLQKRHLPFACFLVALSLLWVFLSEIGRAAPAGSAAEILARNDQLWNLIIQPWPFLSDQPPSALLLPAALIGKIFGWEGCCVALFTFTTAGALLSLLWFVRLVGHRRRALVAIVFIFLGGLDVIGHLLYADGLDGTMHIESWARAWRYSSNTPLLFWTPNNAIAAWIASGLLARYGRREACQPVVFGLFVVTLFWSPPVALGLFFLWVILMPASRLTEAVRFPNFVSFALASVYGVSYLMKAESKSYSLGFYFLNEWPRLLLFSLFEYGLLAVVIQSQFWKEADGKRLFYGIVLTLFLLPLAGRADLPSFTEAAAIPLFFVFWIFVTKYLISASSDLGYRFLLLFLFFGLFSPLAEISRNLSNRWDAGGSLSVGHASSHTPLLFIEAETYENETRLNHVQEDASARGEKLVNRGFGESRDDALEYVFQLDRPVPNGLLSVFYATEAVGAECRVVLNGRRIGFLRCPRSGGWARFVEKKILLPSLNPGRHRFRIESNGVNINLDYFVIYDRL